MLLFAPPADADFAQIYTVSAALVNPQIYASLMPSAHRKDSPSLESLLDIIVCFGSAPFHDCLTLKAYSVFAGIEMDIFV